MKTATVLLLLIVGLFTDSRVATCADFVVADRGTPKAVVHVDGRNTAGAGSEILHEAAVLADRRLFEKASGTKLAIMKEIGDNGQPS